MTPSELIAQMLSMLDRVEWVRASGGSAYVCPFCHAISQRHGGPGHQEDCEGELVRREGQALLR